MSLEGGGSCSHKRISYMKWGRRQTHENWDGSMRGRKKKRGAVISSRLRSKVMARWLRWCRGSVLAFGTQVRRFEPNRSHWIFQGKKILSTPSFGGEVKPSVPCRFTACKRSLNVTWKSGIFRQNSSAIFSRI